MPNSVQKCKIGRFSSVSSRDTAKQPPKNTFFTPWTALVVISTKIVHFSRTRDSIQANLPVCHLNCATLKIKNCWGVHFVKRGVRFYSSSRLVVADQVCNHRKLCYLWLETCYCCLWSYSVVVFCTVTKEQ